MQQRLVLGIEYDGADYHGWQKQKDKISIQETLEKSLVKIASHTVTTTCAGRTDAGVHALCQVIHCDINTIRPEKAWIFGTNRFLPADIRVLWAKCSDSNFDARKSALFRRYCYVIYNNPIRPSILRNYVTWCHQKLNIANMQKAANHWLGEHDFSSFRDSDCQSKSSIRRVDTIKINCVGEFIIFDIIANAFLHHMIRNMIGVLTIIGMGKATVNWAKEVLKAKDRKAAGNTASPSGLYLVEVGYPKEFALPIPSSLPWFLR